MRRALFWTGVALTVGLVAFGIWYFVRDDYPFQLTSGQILGLSYHSVAAGTTVSGYVSNPPAELADWISSMEKDSSDEPVPVTTVVTVDQVGGSSLLIYLGGSRGYGRWVEPDGTESAPIGVQLNQAFVWYVRGVGDGLSASQGVPEPAPGPASLTPSPAATSPSP
jgi:hypothetical protein